MDKSHFSSRIGTILTMIGVAVGLGNVWRFPYMMGSYGGSAFLLIYLLFTILFAFPAIMTEMSLGRKVGNGTITSLQGILGSKIGGGVGIFLLFVVTISGSYYAVIVGNVFFSALFSVIIGYQESTEILYRELLSDGLLQYAFTLVLIIVALYIIYFGISRGVELTSKIVMPFFGFSIVYLIVYALTLPGAISKLYEFIRPEWSAIGTPELFAALGQSFFSLGLGGTFVIVYAGFMKSEDSIPKTALLTSFGDLGSSLLVSLFLVPCILVFGMDMDSGPSLIFNTFPELFAVIPAGRFIGSLFLVSLGLVAFLSLIAAYQVPIRSIETLNLNISRNKLIILIGIIQALLIIPSSFFPQIIGTLDLIFGSGMQVFGSLIVILGVWWSVNKQEYIIEIISKNKPSIFGKILLFWFQYIIPATLAIVLLGYIINNF